MWRSAALILEVHWNPLRVGPNGPKVLASRAGGRMQIPNAKDSKYCFGRLTNLARAEPVKVVKHACRRARDRGIRAV